MIPVRRKSQNVTRFKTVAHGHLQGSCGLCVSTLFLVNHLNESGAEIPGILVFFFFFQLVGKEEETEREMLLLN